MVLRRGVNERRRIAWALLAKSGTYRVPALAAAA
jgi:hypothetical protein